MQNYTTIEQSKKLVELGLNSDTADMCWGVDFESNDYDVNYLNVDDCLLYLRPMSSMTSKEWVEFCDCSLKDEMSWVWTGNRQKFIPVQNREDYLNSKHFDYRGLIPMGLALKAHEGMYDIKGINLNSHKI